MNNLFAIKRGFLLFVLSFSVYLFGNNIVSLTDPDEVFYSLSAREMIARDDWSTAYIFNHPQFEKPIFMYWLLKIAFLQMGENPFAARFFPALFAALGVVGIYCLGILGFVNERRAFLSGIVLASCAFYIAMSKTVFTDVIFTVLILYSMLAFYFGYVRLRYKSYGLVLFFVMSALAVLTKGPLGLLIPAASVLLFLIYQRQFSYLFSPWTIIGFLLFLVVCGPWYWYEYQLHGQAFIQEFFYNAHVRRLLEAEHGSNDRFWYYPLTIIWGTFPWSLFLIAAIGNLYKKLKFQLKPIMYFVLSWMLMVFCAFQFAHSKLTSYILPMWPALALLIANYIDENIEQFQQGILKRLGLSMAAILCLLGIAPLAGFSFYSSYVPSMIPAYWLSAALISLAGIILTLLIKDRILLALEVLSMSVLPFIIGTLLISAHLEPYISMKDVSNYIPSRSMKVAQILTLKGYARGLAFHSEGQEVSVLQMGRGGYFSPHPILMINSDDQLREYLNKPIPTYVVVKKVDKEFFQNFHPDKFKVTQLKQSGYNYVLKVEPKPIL